MISPRRRLTVVVPDRPEGRVWRRFADPVALLVVRRVDEMPAWLDALDRAVRRGLYAAGFITYEAAPGFDPALVVHPPAPGVPLAVMGLYRTFARLRLPVPSSAPGPPAFPGAWRPDLTKADYHRAVDRIRRYLRGGDTYQVNFTYRLRNRFDGPAWPLFLRLHHAQAGRFSAFVESETFAVCSASPELFFRLDGGRLESRPMKGTAPRGRTRPEDHQRLEALRTDEKNRAENVMIVDMIRNDMGRIARPGSVETPELYAVERYPTVLQMISRVVCRTAAPPSGLLRALFPCASITGAPKARTMQIIRELEPSPRGVYTGSVGYFAPDRRALFNVAIRTLWLDKLRRTAEYGVGGGIVWDSTPEGEYRECRLKARVLDAVSDSFQLLETLLWEPETGYFLLARHLARLQRSAAAFGFDLDPEAAGRALRNAAASFGGAPKRVRLLADRDGKLSVESSPLPAAPLVPWRVGFAVDPVDSRDPFLYHKTTRRRIYVDARRRRPGLADVLLFNERGEVTESTLANLVVERDGVRLTPPVSSGLLPGTFREELLALGKIREHPLTKEDVRQADRLYLINSVRRWIPARLA